MKNTSVTSNTIEWLRYFCIGMVVLTHAVGSPLDGNDVISYHFGVYDTIRILFSEGLCRMVSPTLFIISGYLFFVGMDEWNMNAWVEKIKRRGKSLFVPYILWNGLAICFSLSMQYLKFILIGGDAPDMVAWYHNIGGFRAFWDGAEGGRPFNYPLWFIRDLMVFMVLAPIIFQFVKRMGVIGLSILYLAYVLNYWIRVPGFSAQGLFFFAMGAYFSIHNVNFTAFFRNHVVISTIIAFPFVIMMVLTYGCHNELWGYACRLFGLFGSASTIGIAAFLFERKLLKVKPLLSNSSFFVYAAHGTIVLPLISSILGKILPTNQICLIIKYFSAPAITIAILVFCYYYLHKWMPRTISTLTGGRVK